MTGGKTLIVREKKTGDVRQSVGERRIDVGKRIAGVRRIEDVKRIVVGKRECCATGGMDEACEGADVARSRTSLFLKCA